jgi:hypothetical protein
MLFAFLLVLGMAVLSVALRSFDSVVLHKLGAVGVLATSFLAGYLVTGSTWVGAALVTSWFLLPWLEILTRIRRLRLPVERNLRHRSPPSADLFPALDEISSELEEDGFEHVDDAGWDWDDYQQFFRLFYKEAERCQTAICMIEQHEIAFFYISLSSRGKDGTIWTTWNYPFSYSLKLVPQLRINRVRGESSFHELYLSHRDFLRENSVPVEELEQVEPEEIQEEIQKDLRAQVAHNLAAGVLRRTKEGHIRYSWRGLVFLWIQFIRDLVRLS